MVARGDRTIESTVEETATFQMPPELAYQYQIRVIEPSDGSERRVGMFLPRDRDIPSIEIVGNGDRIVARNEDPETIAALTKIAKHNDWKGIDVEGSQTFRKAVWAAASREGLIVRGYEPEFGEQAKMEEMRRADATRRHRGTTEAPPPTPEQVTPMSAVEANVATITPRTVDADRDAKAQDCPPASNGAELSDADRRLLLGLSSLMQDRKTLAETVHEGMDPVERQLKNERLGLNREVLDNAFEWALESPTLVSAFEKAGYEPAELRQKGRDGKWDTEIADAIYVVRSGLHRDVLTVEPDPERDEIKADVEDRLVAESTIARERQPEPEPQIVREERERDRAERDHESEDLAELFLHGGTEQIAAEPRLVGALEAQAAMKLHIAAVFDGDVDQMTAANLESRQMISDTLRRGLDVSVREPTPVRQIEPVEPIHDLER